MATLTIRNLSDETVAAVRMRAARRGRSMEAEARDALDALASEEAATMATGMVDAFLRERREAAERGE